MQRWVIGVGTILLGAFLLHLAVPRSVAHLLLLPGNAALERLAAGDSITPQGFERIRRSREDALRWVEFPQARLDLGLAHYILSQSEGGTERDPEAELLEARRQLELGLAGEPANPRAWLWLADVDRALGDRGRAAQAVRLSMLAAPRDVNLRPARAEFALHVWDELPPDAKAIAARDAGALLESPRAGAFVSAALEADLLAPLREAVADDAAAGAKLSTLVAELTPTEDTAMPSSGTAAAVAGASAALLASLSPASAMTVQEFLAATENKQQNATLARYFEGFGDALYEFNEVMQEAGVSVFCPPGRARPLVGVELQRRVLGELTRKQKSESDFAAYAGETSLGLVALEILNKAHPCEEAGGEGAPPTDEPAEPVGGGSAARSRP